MIASTPHLVSARDLAARQPGRPLIDLLNLLKINAYSLIRLGSPGAFLLLADLPIARKTR